MTRTVQGRLGFGLTVAEAVGLVSVLLAGALLVGTGAVTIGEVTSHEWLFRGGSGSQSSEVNVVRPDIR